VEEYNMRTAGSLLPGHQMKIVDRNTGRNLPPNSNGEIYVRSQRLTPGYYERTEANAENFTQDDDKLFKTGDMGCIKENGLVNIVGRFTEVIKGDGEQVAPVELESILLTHESVSEAAVIGVPDKDHWEIPMAFVVKDADAIVNQNQILIL
jgi:acyl-CoA synthetase (AMP-forming)/AMP-acid ligase II